MQFKFLGTAAAEGFPAVYCECEYCMEARRRMGKNVRTRSQSLINDDLLIDYPADIYLHVLQNNLKLYKVKYLLITHWHSDHFCPEELNLRGGCFAPTISGKMIIIGSSETYEKYVEFTAKSMPNIVRKDIEFKVIEPFESVKLGVYDITALPARHGNLKGFIYHIKSDGKDVLYAHDTGYFYDSVIEYIRQNRIKFNFITFDCTNIGISVPDDSGHMGLENISRLKKVLKECGAIDGETVLFINHFSHNANPLHEELCEEAAKFGLRVAYDGLEIEI